MNTDTAALRSDLTHRLASWVPAADVAPIADAAVQTVDAWAGETDDGGRAMLQAAEAAALAIVPPQYALAVRVAGVVAQGLAGWWASRVVEVQAGTAGVTEHRPPG